MNQIFGLDESTWLLLFIGILTGAILEPIYAYILLGISGLIVSTGVINSMRKQKVNQK